MTCFLVGIPLISTPLINVIIVYIVIFVFLAGLSFDAKNDNNDKLHTPLSSGKSQTYSVVDSGITQLAKVLLAWL